ncbi:MAG: aldose 1-epimerase family protein, partial [Lachnospiraceae bacterium]|nr:aldose 1-epimerase family protein [Lachnospiraceae bacterium]
MQIELKFGEVTGVVETHGGELVSFKDDTGKEYIWDGNPAYWTGRNPNLFPVVGNLKNGSIKIEGKEYQMGRHGFARNSEFAVAERGEDYVVFELCENEETLKVYPFKFSFRIEHRLTERGFTTEYRVKNTGDGMLPYCVGAHTAFNCPMNEGENFEDYVLEFEKEEEASTILLSERGLFRNGDTEEMLSGKTLPLDYSVYARLDTVVFRGLNSKKVRLKHKETGRGVQMEFEQFPMIAFWTKGAEKAPYICLEPWHGC